ncbi:baseplate J/gp47 family protein [Pinibacter aurantiacus]|uniref:Baseplate J/gp47 family protein n=1 Tax=Pinibacter aurantiacus TaxID=2851599 RepID=A0A9E2W6X8_9BACT|nr:baseplate J/gp47 family protein [Pinibacter aurantiacus]MBV4360544.1 baseplate J/gp47 family protein [Pinibacter aurantiacus]
MKTDLKKYRNILKQEGTARIERYLADLDPASVVMDDRSLANLLLYAQKYYSNVRFMPANSNDFNDSWEMFFEKDVIFILTKIASKNAQHIREAFDLLYKQYDENKNAEAIIELTQYIYQRFQKIKEWLGLIIAHELLHNDLKIFIDAYLSKKAQDFYAVTSLQRWNDKKGRELQEQVATLIDDDIWGTKRDFEAAAKDIFIDGADEAERSANAVIKLNDIFDTLYYVTDATIINANNYFKQILQGEKSHAPQIALLVAFLKMFEFLQQDFNNLPRKHLDYYYSQMLGIQKGNAVSDKTYVYFEMAKGFDAYKIDKGTFLSAGKDKKNVDQWYSVDKDVTVSKASITSIKTMLVDRTGINGKDNDKSAIKGIYTNELQKSDSGTFEPAPWNTFGDLNDYRADIGFAIASPQLYLSQGDRTVTINFETSESIDEQEFDISLIRLLLTGEKKWLDSNAQQDGVSINYLRTEGPLNLVLSFSVSIAQQSAIAAFVAAVHGNTFQSNSPVLQCLLQYPILNEGDEDYYNTLLMQLNVLQKIKTTSFSIRVEVGNYQGASFNGVRNVAIQNHEAELNSSKPFYPFTGTPKVGSSFYISSDELEAKQVKKMAINIDWMLPPNFKTYYDNYFAPYNSNKFNVALSQLKDNCWTRITETPVIDVDSFEPRFRVIRIDFDKPGNEEATDVTKADFSKPEGTIRMKLLYPDFGHSIYPQLITSSAMSKSSDKKSVENYSKILKKHLHDSVIMILLPADLDQRNGSLKAVYDIFDQIPDNGQAGNMLVKALNLIIRKHNGSNVILKKEIPDEEQPTIVADAGNRSIVNDDNLIERILNLGRRLRLVSRDVHHDRDRQTVGDVAESINEELVTTASFILPSESELVALIMNETNIAIGKTVTKVSGELISQRKSGSITPADTERIIKREFSESNEVINDIIAEKIAALLLANEVPPPPYTPLINSISISYVAESTYDRTKDCMYQVTPFGVVETAPYFEENNNEEYNKTARSYIFPQNGVYKGSSTFAPAGMFFIGIKDLVKDHNISVLFQFAEGTRKTENDPPRISWHYLTSNNWVPFKNEDIVSDNTYGLQTTGIIEFAVPDKITNENTLINQPGTFWIAAMVQDAPASFPMLLNIAPNAVTATFRDEGNDPSHYELPLPALKITKLVDAVAAIKKVVQPLASFNGKMPEQGKEYYARVSERLRHKARALTVWDYEHLVLATFPAVFKVKCLNNYYNGNFAAGHVTIVPVCDLRNNDTSNVDLLFPRASYVLLTSIKKFLAARTSPFVKIHVINPELDRILITCKVKFRKGVDKGFYLKQLNADIVRFLTPWANNDIKMLSFSSKVYRSSVTNFIDKRPYVDFVTDVEMFQYVEKEKDFYKLPNGTKSLKETAFTTPHSILVSEQEHNIKLID